MKKFLSLIVLSFVAFILLSQNNVAEAATHSWKKLPQAGSTCQVRAWTDYTTYTSRATSMDFTLESKGNCGNLSYKAFGSYFWSGTDVFNTNDATGNFSFKTPVKKLTFKKPHIDPRTNSVSTGSLEVVFTKNGKNVGQMPMVSNLVFKK